MTQYGLQITVASVIAAIGFSTNSETVVIGSMLISPIGGLIIDLGKGAYASAESANKLGPKQAGWKIVMTLFVPFLIGMVAGAATPSYVETGVVEGRGSALIAEPRLWGTGAAIAAAAGVLFSWSDGDTPGIGIGIATALLPPIVAAGYATGCLLRKKSEAEKADVGAEKKAFPSGTAVGNAFGVFVVNFSILLIAVVVTQLGKSACGNFDLTNSASGANKN